MIKFRKVKHVTQVPPTSSPPEAADVDDDGFEEPKDPDVFKDFEASLVEVLPVRSGASSGSDLTMEEKDRHEAEQGGGWGSPLCA